MTLKRGLQHLWNLFDSLGVRGALRYLYFHTLGRGPASDYWIRPRTLAHAVRVRRGTSDIDAFKQIFVDREYACLDDLPDVRLVVDCGANVGYSSAYFLSTFPTCFVIVVEPDPGNFQALARNLAAYQGRTTLLQQGVWSHPARLALSREVFGDGREWSRQVRECASDEPADFEGVDIGTLLATSGHERISLLKIDIEGAEAVVFAKDYETWLARVDAIAIELHGDTVFGDGAKVFQAAIAGRGFGVTTSCELTICRRPHTAQRGGEPA